MEEAQKNLQEYLHYLRRVKKRSARTSANYELYLSRFFAWLKDKGLNCSGFTEARLADYRKFLQSVKAGITKKNFNQSTINYHLTALREFLKFLKLKGKASLSAEKVFLNKVATSTGEVLSEIEMEKFLNFSTQKPADITTIRDRAILFVLVATGMKVSWLAELKRENIDFVTGKIKLKNEQEFVLPEVAKHHLRQYLNQRRDSVTFLFVGYDRASRSRPPSPLSARSIERLVGQTGCEVFPGRRITPELLRRSFVARLRRQGEDSASISRRLGHKQILSTRNLLRKLGSGD